MRMTGIEYFERLTECYDGKRQQMKAKANDAISPSLPVQGAVLCSHEQARSPFVIRDSYRRFVICDS